MEIPCDRQEQARHMLHAVAICTCAAKMRQRGGEPVRLVGVALPLNLQGSATTPFRLIA